MELEKMLDEHNAYLRKKAARFIGSETNSRNRPTKNRAGFSINRKIGWWLTVYLILTAAFIGLSLHVLDERYPTAIRASQPEYTRLFESFFPGSISHIYEELLTWQE